ncbi:MAG: RNA polymerase factor sigma-54 [Saprospiraceae bacterium]|nr:RNA polymerase factor sigma-54 [Saprospiraceae bacterium]
MLKQSLNQKMLQKLAPQQIQLMKLLQVPTAVLEQRIKEEMEENPALEEGDYQEDLSEADGPSEQEDLYDSENNKSDSADEETGDLPDYQNEKDNPLEFSDYLNEYIADDEASYKTRGDSYNNDEEDRRLPVAIENTFHDYLEQQVGMMELDNPRQEAIARQIIGSIDDDGYLRREPSAILDDLLFSQNISTDEAEIETILKKIQRFDPPGIGARSLQECLLLQLEGRMDREGASLVEKFAIQLAIRILRDHFDEFTKKHYDKLQRLLDIDEEDLKEAIDEILKLNPKPAGAFVSDASASQQYIIPDFLLSNNDGELELTLNARNAPDLRISDHYKDMLRAYKRTAQGRRPNVREREAILFIKQKIDSAKWFIDAIQQRQDTMYRTMYAILQYQYDYFLGGDDRRLRPMILKDIAEVTGLDISTVSRVVNSKFVQTEFGTRRLKDFFSESLQNSEGEEVSTLEVKKILSDLISAESKRKPLSDEKLTELLTEKGYNIARRTVAKYREQLNIPVARLRKEL